MRQAWGKISAQGPMVVRGQMQAYRHRVAAQDDIWLLRVAGCLPRRFAWRW